jgi:hypothetical protein
MGIAIPQMMIKKLNKVERMKFIFTKITIKMWEVVPNIGFELITYRLQGGCSTVELIRREEIKN